MTMTRLSVTLLSSMRPHDAGGGGGGADSELESESTTTATATATATTTTTGRRKRRVSTIVGIGGGAVVWLILGQFIASNNRRLDAIIMPFTINPSSSSSSSSSSRSNSTVAATSHDVSGPTNTLCSQDTTASTNSRRRRQNYWWVGNSWIPPPDVPTYNPHDLKTIFQHHNTLWIGDSTCRQDYVTAYNMMTAKNMKDISVKVVDHNINVNKGGMTESCDHIPTPEFMLCRSVVTTASATATGSGRSNITMDGTNITNANSTHQEPRSNATETIQKDGRFDFVKLSCLSDVLDFVKSAIDTIGHDYSVLVVSVGLWDFLRPQNCGMTYGTNIESTLDYIQSDLGSKYPHIMILWKLHVAPGNANHKIQTRTTAFHKRTRDWFSNHTIGATAAAAATAGTTTASNNTSHQKTKNLLLLDLAMELNGRTYGDKRIAGDMHPHLGSGARRLFIQMLAHDINWHDQCGTFASTGESASTTAF
jgi:hypothetical protein